MNWNNEIQACLTPDDVVAVINDFVAGQTERFWSKVPQKARPEILDGPEDVHRWHHLLVQQIRRAKTAPNELQELCVLFLHGSVRLHQLDLKGGDERGPSNEDFNTAPPRAAPKLWMC